MAQVADRPFVTRIFDQILDWGIRTAVLSVGHMAECVRDALGDRYRGLELRYARENKPLGTAGALRNALDSTSGEQLLVMNGDSYCEIDGPAFLESHIRSAAPVTLALVSVADASRYGFVEMDGAGVIRSFAARPERSGTQGLINAGVYAFCRQSISTLPPGKRISLEEQVFPDLVGAGLRGWAAGTARFIDIGTPEGYAAAAAFFEDTGARDR